MKKILLIGMTSGVGGVETFITNILENIDRKQFDVDVLLFQDVNDKYAEIYNLSNVIHVAAINKKPLKYLKDVIELYRTHTYDIIHVNECTAKLFVYCWPAIFNGKTKIIIHSHNGSGEHSILNAILKRIQNFFVSNKWSCSKSAAEWMFGNNTRNIEIIKNGVSVDDYLYNSDVRAAYRNKFNIESTTTVIGSVARFEKQKNQKFIVEIFNEYLKINDDSLLVLVGEGSLKENVIKQVDNLGIANKVLFLSNRNDIPKLLQMFDVVLMPSLYEGLPFVSIEAQAAGVPVIISNNVDPDVKITERIYFTDIDNGAQQWVTILQGILTQVNRRLDSQVIKENFRKTGYDLNESIRQIENLYREI